MPRLLEWRRDLHFESVSQRRRTRLDAFARMQSRSFFWAALFQHQPHQRRSKRSWLGHAIQLYVKRCTNTVTSGGVCDHHFERT